MAEKIQGGPAQVSLHEPTKTLHLYHRIFPGHKHLFATSSSAPATYFITNPVPHKHADQWKPVFHRGDNPKYCADSTPVARAWRKSMWNSFRLEVGDGVGEVLENKRRRKARISHERKQGLRRLFCMGEKPPKEELKEESEVRGLVAPLKMSRDMFVGRTLRWELGGQEYAWKGTRRFMPSSIGGIKGISHDFKLVNADNVVVATFEKDRWCSFRRSEKCEGTPNKKKTYTGTLRIYAPSQPAPAFDPPSSGPGGAANAGEEKETKNLNLGGPHSGDLTEEAIAFTCWIAVEAEHRLRYKIFDLLEEVGESAGG
ncbi:hypothetical protein VUR80DRAFT_3693 [Thermomyces stellatus]